MGREFELKFAATEQVQAQIAARFGGFHKIEMETTYFDTPSGALSCRKMTLRLRKENGEAVCTLKTPLPDGSRGEWECHAATIEDGVAEIARLGAPAGLMALAREGLEPVCGARFTRLAAQVPTADGMAELALDSGVLLGGGREMPLCEVEVELKSGSDEALRALADALAGQYALQPQKGSKFRRALALAKGE